MHQSPECQPLRIFFSAGEPSGDLHAANLIRALRARHQDIEFMGYGGPLMAQAGCRLHADLTALAVMWFLRVLLNIHRFLNLVSQADRYFRHHRPDAVVLIDYPGFNWWIARRASAHGIKVFYYAPPQIWAWGSWRVKKMRRWVDHVLCTLPFEKPWLEERGCHATFVGHPFFDEVRRHQYDQAFCDRYRSRPGPLVTILPGSRTQEVTNNLHWFLKAARLIKDRVPNVRFAIASFKPQQADIARQQVAESGLDIEVHVGRTPELIQVADCCMAVSGSVSLELLYHGKPTVILYWITRTAYQVQERFRHVKYITLVNMLAADELFPEDLTPYDPKLPGNERVVFPEYLTYLDKSQALADHITQWLTNPASRAEVIRRLEALRREVAHGGASQNAAACILESFANRPVVIPRPHFLPHRAKQADTPSGSWRPQSHSKTAA